MKKTLSEVLDEHALTSNEAATDNSAPSSNSIKYNKLVARTNQLANCLLASGIKSGQRIAIMHHQSLELELLMLACFRIGAIYIPISVDEEPDNIAYILRDCEPSLTLCAAENFARLPQAYLEGGKTQTFTDLLTKADGASEEAPDVSVAETDLAYLIYTSGTTGKPRGVQICHSAITYWLQVLKDIVPHSAEAPVRMMSFISPKFDAHIWEHLTAWATGGCNVIVPPDIRTSAPNLARFMVDSDITHALLLPTILRELLPVLKSIQDSGTELPITDIYSTGEELTADIVAQALDLGIRVWNCYGSTEEGFGMSVGPCTRANLWEGHAPVAEPVGESRAFLVDVEGCPDTQQLCTTSPHMSPGYWNAPEQTKQKFTTITIDGNPVRVFRTEDQFARHNGTLYYMGRSAHSHLKIHGRMVRLQDLEEKLRAHPEVTNACVVPYRMEMGARSRTVLHAFYTVSDSGGGGGAAPLGHNALRSLLAKNTSPESIPLHFEQIEAISTTLAGKVDRSALTERARQFYQAEPLPLPPFEPQTNFPVIEEMLIAIWREVLQNLIRSLPVINANTPFQFLGGTSIEAPLVTKRIASQFKVSFAVTDLPKDPNNFTINFLAGLIYKKLCAQAGDDNRVLLHNAEQPSGPPIFLIHAITGDATVYTTLARELVRLNRTVYGICSRVQKDERLLCSSMGAIAADYATLINHTQPDGPCTLMGWSSGSTIAYSTTLELETAHQREVGYLGLLDGISPHIYKTVGNSIFIKEIALLINKLGIELHADTLARTDAAKLDKSALINWIFRAVAGQLGEPTPTRIKIAHHLMLALIQIDLADRKTLAVPQVFPTYETIDQMKRLEGTAAGGDNERALGWLTQQQPITIFQPIGKWHRDIIETDAEALVAQISTFAQQGSPVKPTVSGNHSPIPEDSPLLAALRAMMHTIPDEKRPAFLAALSR